MVVHLLPQYLALFFLVHLLARFDQTHSASLSNKKFIRTKSVDSEFCRPPEGDEVDVVEAKGVGDCLVKCSRHAACAAAAFSKSQKLCLLYNIVWGQDRCRPERDWTLWNGRKECSDGGDDRGHDCRCVSGYVGQHCDRLVEDCMEAHQSGHYPKLAKQIHQDVLRVRPDQSPYDMTVKCASKGRVTLFRTNEKTPSDFNKTWTDYVRGFGHPKTSYFLGLQNIFYLVSAKSYNLSYYVSFNNRAGQYPINYNNFSLADNSTYRVSIGDKREPSRRDILGDIDGRRFSTFDNYGSLGARDCALERGGGWWFGSSDCGNYSVCGLVGPAGEGDGDPRYVFVSDISPPGTVKHIALMLERQN